CLWNSGIHLFCKRIAHELEPFFQAPIPKYGLSVFPFFFIDTRFCLLNNLSKNLVAGFVGNQ
ncbi:MAG: hypothetical protein SFV22_12015, partial [Saprospiraceae bacterium]|nr:hypothetical protein [Saprospiraceae bacterium]